MVSPTFHENVAFAAIRSANDNPSAGEDMIYRLPDAAARRAGGLPTSACVEHRHPRGL
jgi:hypothetical protein